MEKQPERMHGHVLWQESGDAAWDCKVDQEIESGLCKWSCGSLFV